MKCRECRRTAHPFSPFCSDCIDRLLRAAFAPTTERSRGAADPASVALARTHRGRYRRLLEALDDASRPDVRPARADLGGGVIRGPRPTDEWTEAELREAWGR